jgi:hypothetical protein
VILGHSIEGQQARAGRRGRAMKCVANGDMLKSPDVKVSGVTRRAVAIPRQAA